MEERRIGNLKIEGAKLVLKNFSGKPGQFNHEGDRNFGVLIDEESVEILQEDGWNISRFKPREEDDNPFGQAFLKVKVKYGKVPPIAMLITSRGKTRLDEDTIEQLDWTNMKNVDLVIRPYQYPEMNGRPAGVSAYLKAIYVTVMEDDFEAKYADLPYLGEE